MASADVANFSQEASPGAWDGSPAGTLTLSLRARNG
jgi:hypothetical protein